MSSDTKPKNVGLILIVCGGRNYMDQAKLFSTLDRIHATKGINTIIQGEAKGADALAKLWAAANKVTCVGFKADWELHGKAAGVIRNAEMIKFPGVNGTVAFPGGRGTQDMIVRTMLAKLPVMNIAQEADKNDPSSS